MNHPVVEEKPEVKKASGVYYTPAYIVQNTAGKLIADVLSTCGSRRQEALSEPAPVPKKKSTDPGPDLGLLPAPSSPLFVSPCPLRFSAASPARTSA